MTGLKSRPRSTVDIQLQLSQLVASAEVLTRYNLATNAERLQHSEAVAARAELLTVAVDDDQRQ